MHSVSIARETAFRRAVKLILWMVAFLLLLTAVAAEVKSVRRLLVSAQRAGRACAGDEFQSRI